MLLHATCATSAPSPAPTSAMPTKYANTSMQRAADAADQRRHDHADVLLTPIIELASIAPRMKP